MEIDVDEIFYLPKYRIHKLLCQNDIDFTLYSVAISLLNHYSWKFHFFVHGLTIYSYLQIHMNNKETPC